MPMSRKQFLTTAFGTLAGAAVGVSLATPAQAAQSIHDQARVFGGFWSNYQGICPCGWHGDKFPGFKPGAKAGAQGEVNWHKNRYGD